MNQHPGLVHVASLKRKRRSRQRPRRSSASFLAVWLSLIGLNWVSVALLLLYFHPLRHILDHSRELALEITLAVAGCLYFWVAYAVHHRRKYILDIAFACAGLGLLMAPIGTVLSICLMGGLMSHRHDFTR